MTVVAFKCATNGHILSVYRGQLPAGATSLQALVHPASRAKAENFVNALNANELALDWELNVGPLEEPVTLKFGGCGREGHLLVIAIDLDRDLGAVVWDVVRGMPPREEALGNCLLNALATGRQRSAARRGVGELDDMSRLNNELVNLQRELAVKNAQLERTLTTLRETQAQLIQSEKMRGLGQVVSGVAHEVNNPLSYVKSHLHTLEQAAATLVARLNALRAALVASRDAHATALVARLDSDEALQFALEDMTDLLPEAIDGVSRISEIVRSLRTFSRLDEADFKRTNLAENMASTLVIARSVLGPAVDVRVRLDHLPAIDGYPAALNQVFLNLMTNAAQAMPDGGRLTIDGELDGDVVVLRFSDTGTGIAPDDLDRVFEPFFTTKDVGQGMGLGLAISHEIISVRHHGEIGVESSPGEGTTVTLRLPVRQTPGS